MTITSFGSHHSWFRFLAQRNGARMAPTDLATGLVALPVKILPVGSLCWHTDTQWREAAN